MSKDARSRWPYVFMSAFLGTAIEQYDFLLYGTASALVFSKIFFPNLDPLAGTIASLGTYAAGYFARGAGALICGHFGDRIGRKTLLLATLMVMGVASTLVGLLPTYAMIGIWAPVLLTTLRVFQGRAQPWSLRQLEQLRQLWRCHPLDRRPAPDLAAAGIRLLVLGMARAISV